MFQNYNIGPSFLDEVVKKIAQSVAQTIFDKINTCPFQGKKAAQ
jgi:hypothetical protein